MTQNNNESSPAQNFFSGFLLGAVVSSVTCYLTLTKSGRKTAREILRRAEQIGEEGQDFKKKTEKKIDGIIGKLKHEVRAVKKG